MIRIKRFCKWLDSKMPAPPSPVTRLRCNKLFHSITYSFMAFMLLAGAGSLFLAVLYFFPHITTMADHYMTTAPIAGYIPAIFLLWGVMIPVTMMFYAIRLLTTLPEIIRNGYTEGG